MASQEFLGLGCKEKTMKKIANLMTIALGVGTSAICMADRDLDIPTAHLYADNRTEAQMDAYTNQGFRLFDLEIVSTSPYRFAGSFVKNEGPYAKKYWWTANKTEQGLKDFYNQRNARILDLEVTVVNGARRYHGTFISNTGADETAWQWFDNATMDQIYGECAKKNMRVTDLEVVQVGNSTRYAGVMVNNTGSNQRIWGMFANRSLQEIGNIVGNNRRIVDTERTGNTFSGVYEELNGTRGWRQYNRTWDQMNFAVQQFGARVTDIERREVNGEARYDYILINNSNGLETRIGDLLRDNSDGARGFYLKTVGGGVIGDLMADRAFYPASTIKVLQHLLISRRVGQGTNPGILVPHYSDHTSDTHPGNNSTIAFTRTITNTARQMMINSNNQSTNAFQDYFGGGNGVTGRTLIEQFKAQNLGLSAELRISHKFLAGGPANDPANSATLQDLGQLYELAVGNSILNATGWAFFRNNMLNETSNNGFDAGITSIVVQEANTLGLTAGERNAFLSNIRLLWKAGNWSTTYFSSAGWIQLPIRRKDGNFSMRGYVLGAYIDNCTTSLVSITGTVMPEIMREEIRKALEIW
ncbi:MAG: serine hydrolase [Fimbriimonas sp.]